VEDYRHLSLSLKAHPVAFLRERLAQKKILRSEELAKLRNGVRATVAGLVLVRQRPGSANGVIFLTVEDETGIANIIVWPKIFEALRSIVLGASFLAASGRVQIEAGVIHIVMERAEDLTPLLSLLSGHNGEISGGEISGAEISSFARSDEVRHPNERDSRAPREKIQPSLFATDEPPPQAAEIRRVLPKGRNFH
jgi:error-prone DNA polymerase